MYLKVIKVNLLFFRISHPQYKSYIIFICLLPPQKQTDHKADVLRYHMDMIMTLTIHSLLTYGGFNKMVTILQVRLSNSFSWMTNFDFLNKISMQYLLPACLIDYSRGMVLTGTKPLPQPMMTKLCDIISLIARLMGPTWGPSGANRTQVGSMLAPWILLSGMVSLGINKSKLILSPGCKYMSIPHTLLTWICVNQSLSIIDIPESLNHLPSGNLHITSCV